MLISHISADRIGRSITLKGWINHIRSSGKISFVELRDGSGYIQCIVEQKVVGDTMFDALNSCGIESALSITGTVAKHPKKEEFEIQTSALEVLSKTQDYPL